MAIHQYHFIRIVSFFVQSGKKNQEGKYFSGEQISNSVCRFRQEIPMIPKWNVKSKLIFQVLWNDNNQIYVDIIKCADKVRIPVYGQLWKDRIKYGF